MNYLSVEEGIQGLFEQHMTRSKSQSKRIARLSVGILLAGEVHLTKIARFLKGDTQQDSRVRWIERLLKSPFLKSEYVYHPMLKEALKGFKDRYWHLVIDRTTLWDGEIDLTTISLNYRKRAIPLVWRCVPYGGTQLANYVELLHECVPLIPREVTVVFHGDTEFGGALMIRALRQLKWDFILAQFGSSHFRRIGTSTSQALSRLPVTKRRSCQLAGIDLFAYKPIGDINIFAFYQKHYTQCGKLTREMAYLATSLPLTPGLKRLGRRRWGTEPFYRDYKSSGWKITDSRLKHSSRQESILVMLALLYLLSVCFGRWLCKTGQRHWVDARSRRHLRLFRIGWDRFIHLLIDGKPYRPILRLYS